MSKVIDNKVVEMSFDNRNFETNVKTSLGTLDKLKKSLNFDDATKGFENLDKASKKLSFDSIGDGIEEVKAKFSALDIVAFTALQNITNKVVETGRQMVRSLTIDPVKSGWDKFAEKTQAVQTIMSATVTTWEDEAAAMGGYDSQMDFVNDQIEKLNWYADETSYSLTDMVSNVGKFTAAGQGLGTSVEALMGISNWGARSGSEINQLSRAYYNLSQALGKGMLSLQDWMSIENANMATYEFKEQLIQAGLAMGKLKEAADAPPGTYEIIGAQNEFFVNPENLRETLKEGWVTSDVMMYVYREYGKASKLLSEISERASDTFTTTGFLNDLEELQEAGSKISVKDIADRYGIEDVEKLAKEVAQRCALYDIHRLHVVNLGDMIAGRIHLRLRLNSRIDSITQIIEVSEIIANFLYALSTFLNIEYYDTLDNHSRLEPKLSDSLDLESLVRITTWFLRERLKDVKTIHFNNNTLGDDIASFTCLGHNIIAVHGDKDKPETVVQNLSLMTQSYYDLALTAHRHHFFSDEINRTIILSNSSLMGTDELAQQLRLTASASQNLIIVTENNVVDTICRINVE